MYLNTTPRRMRYYLELLEPVGLRWEAERWFDHASTMHRGRRNTPLPPDGWHLVHTLAYARSQDLSGTQRVRRTSTVLKAFRELSDALGQRYRHPAFSGVAFSQTAPIAKQAVVYLPARRYDAIYGPFALVDEALDPGNTVTLMLSDTHVANVGPCWHYRPISWEDARSRPWRQYDPANPLLQARWIEARFDLEYGKRPNWF